MDVYAVAIIVNLPAMVHWFTLSGVWRHMHLMLKYWHICWYNIAIPFVHLQLIRSNV